MTLPSWLLVTAGVVCAVAWTVATVIVSRQAVNRRWARTLSRALQAADAVRPQPNATGDAPSVEAADEALDRVTKALTTLAGSSHALLERERSFTRYASHELRTPVSAMKLQLERVTLEHAQAAEVMPALVRQVARIEELIDALLALARARDVDAAAPGTTRAVRDLIAEVLEPLPDDQRRRVYLVDPLPTSSVRDPVLLRQALRNLVENGLRHGSGPVTVACQTEGETLTARVRDMGPGIPAAELRRLADGAALRVPTPEGHGLGLTLVQLIARALGGRLLLHNTETGLEASLTVQVAVPSHDRGGP